ncbi:MAG: hypothetical protein CMI34_00270 [Opitutales bacterium]|jgi:hypothetical protein|nr:hypothetical protein [Candidatus Neomarinimicrobiota bacterium]MBK99835.1 hypothetical protein [Opitutales bacterium]|tara:strand:- start:10 stop:447 length:438 start_codon:yes stop_codon:yes gene_type:complete
MLSLLGSLLGFGTSFLPKLLGFFEEKRDQAHELKLMDKQLEQQIKLGEQKLQFMNVEADIRETEALQKSQTKMTVKSSQWVINLSSSVRPIMTYLLFLEFMILTFMLAFNSIDLEMYNRIWSNEIQAVWAAVVSFWFGQRSFNRK